jgi:hypothetical protein
MRALTNGPRKLSEMHKGDVEESRGTWCYGKEPYLFTESSTNSIECLAPKDVLEAAMWWSRESRKRRKEALTQRPHIKEALAEGAPISQEIDDNSSRNIFLVTR